MAQHRAPPDARVAPHHQRTAASRDRCEQAIDQPALPVPAEQPFPGKPSSPSRRRILTRGNPPVHAIATVSQDIPISRNPRGNQGHIGHQITPDA
ncbi:hypothetical protein FAGKG844_530010 [Frankia sp. AgKG'84/4]